MIQIMERTQTPSYGSLLVGACVGPSSAGAEDHLTAIAQVANRPVVGWLFTKETNDTSAYSMRISYAKSIFQQMDGPVCSKSHKNKQGTVVRITGEGGPPELDVGLCRNGD